MTEPDADCVEVIAEPFALVPRWVARALRRHPLALQFYVFLAVEVINCRTRQGFRTEAVIAEEFGVDPRTVRRWLAECVKVGAVRVVQTRRGDGNWGRNVYFLPRDNPETLALFDAPKPASGQPASAGSEQAKEAVSPGRTGGHRTSGDGRTPDVRSGNETQRGTRGKEKDLPTADAIGADAVDAEIVDAEIVDEHPRDETPEKADLAKPVNAGTLTAQWIDWCKARNITLPPRVVGRYAAKFKELLGANFPPAIIGAALAKMAAENMISRVDLLDSYVIRVQAGAPRPESQFRSAAERRRDEAEATRNRVAEAEAIVRARGGNPNDSAEVYRVVRERKSGMVRQDSAAPAAFVGMLELTS